MSLNYPDSTFQGIQNGPTSLVDLVKILGPYLTSEEPETRVNGEPLDSSYGEPLSKACAGVELLVEVINKLPDASFTRQSSMKSVYVIHKVSNSDQLGS